MQIAASRIQDDDDSDDNVSEDGDDDEDDSDEIFEECKSPLLNLGVAYTLRLRVLKCNG